ncbi:MAG: ATP-binding protein [Myxococcales bacterium]
MAQDASNTQEQSAARMEQRVRELELRLAEVERERGLSREEHAETCPQCADAARRASEAEAQFHSMFVEAFEGLAISIDGKIVLANPALGALGRCDPSEIVGKTVLELTTPEESAVIMRRIRAGDRTPCEVTAIRPDGSSFPCEVMGRNVIYGGCTARLTTFRDLTVQKNEERARRRFEERLQSAKKLETLGMIAGGIAHDFNNLLLVMMGHAELAMSQADLAVEHHLHKIRGAAQAASELTSQMLTFAGRGALDREPVQLGQVVREVVELYQPPQMIDVRIDLQQVAFDAAPILGDPAQIRQVVLNLLINAAEALSEQGQRIAFRVHEVERSAEELHELMVDASAGPGRFVQLEVQDEGCGMEPETLNRVFDPFFSTKFQGRGLGLASVLGIVRSHAGAVHVESAPGRGARFSLLFPVAQS